MFRKTDFAFIEFTLIGIFILFTCFSAIGGEKSTSDKEQSKKITQVNNENNNGTNMLMDYALIPFTQLIGMSDLIVIGAVKDIGDSTFNFHLDEFLLNSYSSDSLIVRKFIPSKFDEPRVLPYFTMQRFVLFLTKPLHENAQFSWNIIGHAGEGEMPIDDDFIYFEGYDLKGLEHKSREVHGVTRKIRRFNLDDFKDAVKKYNECFSWKLVEYMKNKKKRYRWVPSKTCLDVTVKNYQTKSWLHNYLVRGTVKRIPVKTNE